MQTRRTNSFLMLAHIILIVASNILVQYPFAFLGFQTTWGALSYPLIFILTDLTIRFLGKTTARKIVFAAMGPGLIFSYLLSNLYLHGHVWLYNPIALRIALASFLAYLAGQLLDIAVFQKLRQQQRWWVAPSVASVIGNFVDTYVFFFIAFYHGADTFMSIHWPAIARVDLAFKLLISLGSFIPLYGVILRWILRKQDTRLASAAT